MPIQVKDLQIADILLSSTNSGVSWAIRSGTLSRYSHAALYIGNGEIIEAVKNGVLRVKLAEAIQEESIVSVYRRRSMSTGQANMVVRYATQQLGKEYDASGAIGGGITSNSGYIIGVFLSPVVVVVGIAADAYNRSNPAGKFYCSELVAIAFEYAKAPLGKGSASTTPKDVSRSQYLNYVGDLKGPK